MHRSRTHSFDRDESSRQEKFEITLRNVKTTTRELVLQFVFSVLHDICPLHSLCGLFFISRVELKTSCMRARRSARGLSPNSVITFLQACNLACSLQSLLFRATLRKRKASAIRLHRLNSASLQERKRECNFVM